MSKKRKRHRHFRPRRRDFWRAWREMMAENKPGHQDESGYWDERGTSPSDVAEHWRRFFHDFMGAWPEKHWAFGGRRFNPWRQGQVEFNPFVASLLSKGGGLLPLLVLHLLADGPRYGNELMDEIAGRTQGQWLANPGAIYPLMTLLEHQGLVSGDWEDPRKRTVRNYQLTEVGREELGRLQAIVRPKLDQAIAVLQDLADALDESVNGTSSENNEMFV